MAKIVIQATCTIEGSPKYVMNVMRYAVEAMEATAQKHGHQGRATIMTVEGVDFSTEPPPGCQCGRTQ